MDIATETVKATTKRCSTCKITPINGYSTFVNCPGCRDKNRQKSERAKQRKMERAAHIRSVLDRMNSDDESSSQNRHVSGLGGFGPPIINSSGGVKRKAPKQLCDLEGEEQRLALGVIKNGLKQTVKGNKRVVTPTRLTSTAGEGKEYQTASAIYDTLKRRVAKAASSTNRLHFNGFHAIIANHTIDNEKRVSMVANDLRKISRIPFDHTKPSSSYNFETMGRSVEYRCTCRGNDTTPPTISALAGMKGTDGDLIRMARQRTSLGTTPLLCGGKVRITAVDDGRHPLGILAQRISISIEHLDSVSKTGSKTKIT